MFHALLVGHLQCVWVIGQVVACNNNNYVVTGDNTEEAIAKRKSEARKWIDDWRAKQN